MNHPWTSWLLAGALAASLAWNLLGAIAPAPACSTSCGGALDVASLGLTAEQTRELEKWRATACDQSCRADSQASAKLDELHAALRDRTVSPAKLDELAAEVSRLRADSLTACVDSIVAVRRVLTPEQLGLLLDRCCSEGACSK